MSAKLDEMLRIAEAATQGPTAMPGEQRVIDDEIYVTMLLAYQQADMDGTMVLASRQAIHETVDALRATKGQLRDARAEVEAHVADRVATALRHGKELEAAESALSATKAKLEAATAALRQHHKWHLDAGEMAIAKDDKGEWIALDMSAEYGDSTLCEITLAALTSKES